MTEQKKNELRLTLQNAAVYVTANYGLDKATTKELATRANVNEAYIYRLFENKEDLLVKTFSMLDRELLYLIASNLDGMRDESRGIDERCFELFYTVWHFLLDGADRCMYYMQFYYSPYFTKYSMQEHRILYDPVVERFSRVFKGGVDVWRMLTYILDIILAMSIKILRKEIENTPEFEQKVFDLLYRALQPYLDWTK